MSKEIQKENVIVKAIPLHYKMHNILPHDQPKSKGTFFKVLHFSMSSSSTLGVA